MFVNEDVGVVDLLFDFNNLWIIYVFIWCVCCILYSFESGGEGFGFWKSIDGGDIWINIFFNKGLFDGVWGISGVVVLFVNSNCVWVIIENEKGGVYCLDDGGENWWKINDSCVLC